MNIGKGLAELLATFRNEAEDAVILLVVILALVVGIAWLDRYESTNDPPLAVSGSTHPSN
jgi:hypothetical protein